MARYQENNRRKRMWFGTQHHSEWITCPLRGAEMTPESWGLEGTYLSGGGFVRQSQDSHRQYIFEWSGASSRSSAEIMQAYRDGVYNKAPSDLIYFIDPLVYSRNILPKRWAQPGILTVPGEAEYSPIGVVTPVDTPVSMLGNQRVPMVGAQVSSPITSLNDLNSKTSPGVGSVWVPIPDGETLKVVAWTGNPLTSESGLYVKAQESDGSWRNVAEVGPHGVKVSGAKGVLLATVGTFDFYGARAVIGRGEDWSDPVTYAWTGAPDDSTSTRTTVEGTVTNEYTNPDNVTPSGEVVVWENQAINPRAEAAGPDIGGRNSTGFSLTVGVTPPVPSPAGIDTAVELKPNGPGRLEPSYDVNTYASVYDVDGFGGSSAHRESRLWVYANVATTLDGRSTDHVPANEWTEVTYLVTGVGGSTIRFNRSDGLEVTGAERAYYTQVLTVPEGAVSPPEYFDETYSPDPGLEPQARPGGGSQLVGQQVAGLNAVNGVVVQSTQWSKSGGVSARLINNTGGDLPYAWADISPDEVQTVKVWTRQDRALTVGHSRFGQVGLGSASATRDYSDPRPNEPGEALLQVDRDIANNSRIYLFGYFSDIGESMWFDLLTAADTKDYDGPPFSGSSPAEGPSWLPGSGHSGCKFVGNPTWIANSGVNGGQIGYAATLKEVGDWQQ